MKTSNRRLLASLAGAGLSLWAGSVAAGFDELNMTQGVTPISQEVYGLHMIILWICVAIGVVVFGAMTYSIINHRKSKGAVAAKFHESTTVEILWTIVPFLILVAIAVPATKTLIAMEDSSNSDLTIKVTGYQWKWKYDYLDDGISFFSNLSTPKEQIEGKVAQDTTYLLEVDNPVVVPINKKIRFLMTAEDVIHAWWVPELAVKKDAIPGFINESWAVIEKPGIYRGQCAELCGKDHGFMPVVVVAKAEDEYQQWVQEQKGAMAAAAAAATKTWTMDELMARGKEVYDTACAACHQANGQGIPAAGFPGIAGSAISTGPVDAHIDIVLNGKAGTAMQAFGQQFNDADLAAVVTYERNGFGNDVGDMVQPSDIAAAR